MDRNSVIGLVLIALLLLVYLNWFRPQPPAQVPPPVAADSTQAPTEEKVIPIQEPDSSLLAATYGDAASLFKGEESSFTIQTQDLTIGFTNKGGIINFLKLEHYKTYHKDPSQRKPVVLINRSSTEFQLLSSLKGEKVDLYSWYYQAAQQKLKDTTVVTFTAKLPSGSGLTQTYYVPDKGYEIRYTIASSGLENQLGSDNLAFQWRSVISNTEKDIVDTRNNTTITYYAEDGGFDELNQRSTDIEKESFTRPLEWVTIKQKYFLTAIIANNSFAAGDIELSPIDSDTLVKKAVVNLLIPKKELATGKAEFKYYLGPNDYQLIGNVAEKFSKNVYLGWPPVYWVNKFIIFPVFHFLTLFIDNFGVIIIILVILLKLVLAPLSYRSYLSMAKMKVLKPELDEIKEKHGSDMTKIQQEQMKLYQQVGVNPLSGCIPVLMQMPILFAMFYLFPASIELRQEPFLWAEDLSTYDSIIQFSFTIPFMGSHISLFTLLMTVSTLIYTWQNNQLSSVQGPMKSMSYIMPLIFFFVLNSFSAGLTFYYFVSNLVTFAQQAIIRKFVDDDKIKLALEENRKRIASGGGGKKSKFMTKLEEAMKASEEARKNAQENRKRKKN